MTLRRPCLAFIVMVSLACGPAWGQVIVGPGGPNDIGAQPESAEQVLARLQTALKTGDVVLVARIESVRMLGQTQSMPPSNFGQVALKDVELLKGEKPEKLTFSHSYVSGRGYAPAGGDRVIAVLQTIEAERSTLVGGEDANVVQKVKVSRLQFLHKTTPQLLAAVKDATGKSPSSQPDDAGATPAASRPEGPGPIRLLGPPERLRPMEVLPVEPRQPIRVGPPLPMDEVHEPGAAGGNPGRIRMDGGPVRIDGGPVRIAPIVPDGPGGIAQPAPADPKQQLVNAVTQSPLVFTGTVENVVQGPMAMSEPPILSMTVTFKDVTMLKGDKPENFTFSYRVTRGRGIEPAVDQKLLVAADKPLAAPQIDRRIQGGAAGPAIRARLPIGGMGGGPQIRMLAEANDANIALATKAVKLPAGWSLDKDGKPVSPWAASGAKAWPKDVKSKFDVEIVDSMTGRPALRVPAGITLKVEQIIPADVEKFKNPFGDGKFKVTVANTTDKALDVPALLTNDGKEILWADSLLLLQGDKAFILPGAGRATADVRPVRLDPGQAVSAEIDTLKLNGVSWPRGGSRVHFNFALGQLSEQNFFYYYSDRHDKMRGTGPAVSDDVAGNQAGWTRLFADEPWYKGQQAGEQEFVGTLAAIPHDPNVATTLMRTSHYRLGSRNIYTGAKKVDALDKLVGKRVVIRGKPYDIELEGQHVSEIWPAAVRLATDKDKDTPASKLPAGVMKLDPTEMIQGVGL